MDSVIKRMKRPTPKFFKKLRNVALTLAAAGAAIASAPVALPAALMKVAGYLIVAGSVAGAVSQATVKNDK
jgi:hypothetical protein